MCVIYIVEQNVKVSLIYVYPRFYLTHKFKKSQRNLRQIILPGSDIIVLPLCWHDK